MRTRATRAGATGKAPKTPATTPVPVHVLPVAPGQRIEATVARADRDGTVWLGWRGSLVTARSEVALKPGATYHFTVARAEGGRVQLRAARLRRGLPRLADALVAGLLGSPGSAQEAGDAPEPEPGGRYEPPDQATTCWWCFQSDDGRSWTAVSARWGGVRIDATGPHIRAQVADPDHLPQAAAAIQATWPDHDLHIRPAPRNGIPYGDLLAQTNSHKPNQGPPAPPLLDIKV